MNSLVSICPYAFLTCTLPDLLLKPHFLGLPCHPGPRLQLPRGGGQQRLEGGPPPHQLRLPVLQPHLRRLRRARAGQLQFRRLHGRQVVLHRPQLRHLLPGPHPISKVPCQPLVLRGLRHPHHRLLRVPCSCGSCHRCCLRSHGQPRPCACSCCHHPRPGLCSSCLRRRPRPPPRPRRCPRRHRRPRAPHPL